MSPSKDRDNADQRARYTGESYAKALAGVKGLGEGEPLIADAQQAEQQWVESALLHRLLHGARDQWTAAGQPRFPFFIKEAWASTTGLCLTVPAGDGPAFGAALSMRRPASMVRRSADEVSIRRASRVLISVTAAEQSEGMVDVQCSWKQFRTAVDTDSTVSVTSGISLRFSSSQVLRLEPAERAVLSGLLRRIRLLVEPTALDWLFAWHEWVAAGHVGDKPLPPRALADDLADQRCGLPISLLPALGLEGSARQRSRAERRYGAMRAGGAAALRQERDQSVPAPVPAVLVERVLDAGPALVDLSEARHGEPARGGSPRYNDLAVTVMRLDLEHPIEREYHAMRFPARWTEPLRQLQASRRGDLASISIASLNAAITAVVPDCVVMRGRVGGDDEQIWLLAYDAIDPEAIFRLVAAWVRAQKATPGQIDQALSQLSVTDLVWSSIRISRSLPMSLLARLIPMDVAATLARQGAWASHGDLSFLRCPTENGAEVMSWPPQGVEERMPFSVTIGISVQTVPTSGEPLVYLSFGVRRWLPARKELLGEGPHTVYLAPAAPYLGGLNVSRHFGRANVKVASGPREDGRSTRTPHWEDRLAEVFDHVDGMLQTPGLQGANGEPMLLPQWDGDAVAVAYRNGAPARKMASEGLSIADREPLMSWAIGELHPRLRPVEPLHRLRSTVYKGLAGIAQEAIAPDVLRDAIGPRLSIELFTESEPLAQHVLERLQERLGTPFPNASDLSETETLLDFGGVAIGVRRVADPGIRADVEGATYQPHNEIMARGAAIASQIDRAAHPTAAVVEILSQDRRSGRGADPNPTFELRRTLARTGRLSQFVFSEAGSKRSHRVGEDPRSDNASRLRVSFAVDDLFRQLGVRPVPLPPPAADTLRCRPALLAIWMARQKRGRAGELKQQVPIAVHIDPTGRRVQVRAPGTAWQALPAVLADLGGERLVADRTYGAEETVLFIQEIIDNVVSEHPDTLLLTHAQNLRNVWTFLRNSEIELDALQFGPGRRQPIADWPGLRHARLRTGEGGETPESYGVSDSNIGQPAGLWQYLVPRLFGSTTGKPAAHAQAFKGISKIVPTMHRNALNMAPNPKADVWNSPFIEIFVAGIQDGDAPEHWAAAVHDLRNGAPHLRGTTALPWPLHLAQQIADHLT